MRMQTSPLLDFAKVLGIQESQLAAVETLDTLHHTFTVEGARVAQLLPEHIRSVLDAYSEAIRGEFRIGNVVELVIEETIRDSDIEAFASQAASTSHDFVLQLRKDKLLSVILGEKRPRGEAVLFLFGKALSRVLSQGLASFETELWRQTDRELTVLIADTNVVLKGELLTLLGGEALEGLPGIDSDQTTDEQQADLIRELAAMAESRDRYVGWDKLWTRRLTPLHFHVSGDCEDELLLGLINAQVAKLAVLFTCDRARERTPEGSAPEIRAEFQGGEHLAVVVIHEAAPLETAEQQALDAVATMISWCFKAEPGPPRREWVVDRLPFVQTRIAQTLEGRPEEERFRAFVQTMPYLVRGLDWQWKAFIEGKISEYLDRVHQLEGLVAGTVERLADQVSALTKQLSDAMLAAVAVLIGSFIAAAFKEPFNEPLFRIALLTYATYVGIFPGALGLSTNARSFLRLHEGFEAQRLRYEEVLSPEKVSEIVGGRVERAEESFWRVLGLVALIYMFVVVAAIIASSELPARIAVSP